jgi:NAD(P)-dependent dehydrogenase (short-subunit alcohol dehydrogenase family)
MRLRDQVALVTGAGAGLGRAVALTFAQEGASVVAVSLEPDELAEVEREAARRGLRDRLLPVQADVGDVDDTEQVRAMVLDRFGRLDILVNNAGIIQVRPVEDTAVEEWDRVLRTNLRGPFLYCRAFVPTMKERQAGIIVNVSSRSGVEPFVGESAYCASKFGLEGLTFTLALELRPWNIRAAVVHPGMAMRTPMSMTTYDAEARQVWRDPLELAPGFVRLAESSDPGISGRRFSAWELAQGGEL